MSPSLNHVFISYSQKDDTVMKRIVAFLRDQGIMVWVDNENLVPGTPIWEQEIEKAIIESSAVIVILSPDSKNSEWVRREISYAEQYHKRIFPVLARGDKDSSMTLRLSTHQYIDIREKEELGLGSLASALLVHKEELEQKHTNTFFANLFVILIIIIVCYLGYSQIKTMRNDPAHSLQTEGARLISEDFSSNARGWPVGSKDSEYYIGSISITNGVLEWDVMQVKQSFFSRQTYRDIPVGGDFDVSVEARRVGGTPSNLCYGISFRESKVGVNVSGFYTFLVCDAQLYSVSYYDGRNFVMLQDWVNASVIRPDDWNHLEVVGIGNQFNFYINHEAVSRIKNSSLATGYSSLLISVSDDVPGRVWFDNFQLVIK